MTKNAKPPKTTTADTPAADLPPDHKHAVQEAMHEASDNGLQADIPPATAQTPAGEPPLESIGWNDKPPTGYVLNSADIEGLARVAIVAGFSPDKEAPDAQQMEQVITDTRTLVDGEHEQFLTATYADDRVRATVVEAANLLMMSMANLLEAIAQDEPDVHVAEFSDLEGLLREKCPRSIDEARSLRVVTPDDLDHATILPATEIHNMDPTSVRVFKGLDGQTLHVIAIDNPRPAIVAAQRSLFQAEIAA